MSFAVVQNFSFIHDRSVSQKNFCAMASMKEVNGISKLIEEDSESSVRAISTLQFPGISQRRRGTR